MGEYIPYQASLNRTGWTPADAFRQTQQADAQHAHLKVSITLDAGSVIAVATACVCQHGQDEPCMHDSDRLWLVPEEV
jgi:hypothetical protein